MAASDDSAWKEWSEAYHDLGDAMSYFRETLHLPDDHPDRESARDHVAICHGALNRAAQKFDPAFRP